MELPAFLTQPIPFLVLGTNTHRIQGIHFQLIPQALGAMHASGTLFQQRYMNIIYFHNFGSHSNAYSETPLNVLSQNL